MAWSKIILSGTVDGNSISVTGISASTANVIHTAITGIVDFDEIFCWAFNNATADRLLAIRWAATATAAQIREFQQTIPSQDGLHLVIPGLPLRNALTVEAFATVAGTVTGGIGIVGYVHRVT